MPATAIRMRCSFGFRSNRLRILSESIRTDDSNFSMLGELWDGEMDRGKTGLSKKIPCS